MELKLTWLIIGFLMATVFIRDADCGPGLAGIAAVGCNLVCGTAMVACFGSAATIEGALASNPITAPFAGVLAPFFINGCWGGYAGCMAFCVGSAAVAPSP